MEISLKIKQLGKLHQVALTTGWMLEQ